MFSNRLGARRMEFGGSLIDDFNRANESPLSDAGRWSNNITSIETGLQVASNLLASTSSTTATGWRNDASYGPNV
ncbi:MAG TPA: hypothetical protein VK537_06380, partial [Galbitalea sp.]|nr:hypothetical protein [Galbitalea sp.]